MVSWLCMNNDDNQKNQDLNTPIIQQPTQPQSQTAPVGAIHKEGEPIVSAPVSEYLTPSENKPEISKEVGEAGVKESEPEMPEISFEAKKAGVVESIPEVHTEPKGFVNFPYDTQEKAEQVVKEDKNSTDAKRWMAVSSLRQFLKMLFLNKGDN